MKIGTVNDEHSTLILSFSVFALRCGLPLCNYCISNTIKNMKQCKIWGYYVKSSPLKKKM